MDWRIQMTFKEQLQEGIKNVFFDLDIFAEIHNVDGTDIPVVIDNESLKEISATQKEHTDGLFIGGILFYVSMEHLQVLPSVGNVFYFDNTMYRVFSAHKDSGVAEIILEVTQAW